MPAWTEVLKEIRKEAEAGPIDRIRRKYLASLARYTKRNVIAYYSGWLSADPRTPSLSINDDDKNAFMAMVHKLDRSKGLDLILHTPGGDVAATESIVDYLRRMFGTDIRAIVPQLAMSAGTMIACACSSIVMGKQSSLGPIDPQVNGVPAQGVLSEFTDAINEIKADPAKTPLWQAIIGRYHPSFLGECHRAVTMAKEIAGDWLCTGMFKDLKNGPAREQQVERVVEVLLDHDTTKTHSRHFNIDHCVKMGLRIERLEEDPRLQDLVLTVHHAFMHTFSQSAAVKITENHKGTSMVLLSAQARQP